MHELECIVDHIFVDFRQKLHVAPVLREPGPSHLVNPLGPGIVITRRYGFEHLLSLPSWDGIGSNPAYVGICVDMLASGVLHSLGPRSLVVNVLQDGPSAPCAKKNVPSCVAFMG